MKGTIKSSEEISLLFTQGKRYHTPAVTLIVSRVSNQHGRNGRVAFVAGKKNGNAVWRNAAKRRMRAVCTDLGGPWPNIDVIFLAKRKITTTSYSKVALECKKVLLRALKDMQDNEADYSNN